MKSGARWNLEDFKMMKTDHSNLRGAGAEASGQEGPAPSPVWLWDMILLWSLWLALWSLVTL